jgi:hypothetical protein
MVSWCSGILLFLATTLLTTARPNNNVDTNSMVLTYAETNIPQDEPQGSVTDLATINAPKRSEYVSSRRQCRDGQVFVNGRCRYTTKQGEKEIYTITAYSIIFQ